MMKAQEQQKGCVILKQYWYTAPVLKDLLEENNTRWHSSFNSRNLFFCCSIHETSVSEVSRTEQKQIGCVNLKTILVHSYSCKRSPKKINNRCRSTFNPT